MAGPRKLVGFISVMVVLAAGSAWVPFGRPTPPSGSETPDSKTPPAPPSPPGALVAEPGDARVLLAWTPPEADGGSPLLGYTVYSGPLPNLLTPDPLSSAVGNALAITDLGRANGVVYYYRVVAYNAVGPSDPSDLAFAAPGAFDVAVFAAPRFGVAPFRIGFILSAIDPALTSLGTSSWDFGDGSSALISESAVVTRRLHNVSHTYGTPGVYTVTTAYGAGGSKVHAPKLPVVVLPPLTLEAVANNTSGTAPLATSFRATASGGLPSLSFRWDFGDGTHNETREAEHTYAEAGAYTANVSVRDAAGNEKVQTIEIRAVAPFSWAPYVNFFWIVAVLAGVGFGFVLGWLYGGRRRTAKKPPARGLA